MADLVHVPREGRVPRRDFNVGAYYTLPAVVDFVCRAALTAYLAGTGVADREAIEPLVERGDASRLKEAQVSALWAQLGGLRVIDPACGQGAFLVGFVELIARLWRAWGERSKAISDREPRVPMGTPPAPGLFGIELDPESAALARRRLARVHTTHGISVPAQERLSGRILAGDGLAVWPTKELPRTYDIVLVNPPYLNMVAMMAHLPDQRSRLRASFPTARGGFDLFVPFIERSIDLLGEGGVLAALTPDKLLSASYATALRDHYREHLDLLMLVDLRSAKTFAAGVYPVITIGRRRRPPPAGCRTVARRRGAGGLVHIWRAVAHDGPTGFEYLHSAPSRLLTAVGNRWGALIDPQCEVLASAMAEMTPLAEFAEVCGAATVAEAYAWGPAIVDDGRRLWRRDPRRYAPFLVSGSVERGTHTWAERPVRYLGRIYRQPVLDLESPLVSARRRRQILGGKVILSGLARRPTAVWDEGGLAAAKSTVLVIPRSGVSGVELATALNSDLLARLYGLLFGTLALSGGYLRFGPQQLRALPLPGRRVPDRNGPAQP